MDIVLCGPEREKMWNAYLESMPTATICHHFLWRSVISHTYKHDPLYLLACTGSQVRGILPLFAVRSHLFGKSLTSMPFLDYGGVCADDDVTAEQLVERALQLLPAHGADYVELRQCRPTTDKDPARLDKVGMRLDLTPGIEQVWRSFPAKVRNQVRKAEKAGLQVSIGGGELLDEFYSVFVVNMRDLGSPVHGRPFFSEMFAAFGDQAKIVLVRDGRTPVGGLICLFYKGTATVPWASSLREFLAKCPNNLAYWEAMQYAAAQGCTVFDFGRSSIDSGTYHFKRQWGAEPVQIYWQVLGRKDQRGMGSSAESAKLQMAVELWKRLPVSLTKVIGPRIRKYITN